jgi:hypothetical protein
MYNFNISRRVVNINKILDEYKDILQVSFGLEIPRTTAQVRGNPRADADDTSSDVEDAISKKLIPIPYEESSVSPKGGKRLMRKNRKTKLKTRRPKSNTKTKTRRPKTKTRTYK